MRGTGQVDGVHGYRMMIWAFDEPDLMRIRIRTGEEGTATELVLLDSGLGTDEMVPVEGAIVVHANR